MTGKRTEADIEADRKFYQRKRTPEETKGMARAINMFRKKRRLFKRLMGRSNRYKSRKTKLMLMKWEYNETNKQPKLSQWRIKSSSLRQDVSKSRDKRIRAKIKKQIPKVS